MPGISLRGDFAGGNDRTMATTAAPVPVPTDHLDAAASKQGRPGWRRHPSLELLGNLTMREIRSQYKRTVLGRLWSYINPLATIAIYSLVFGLLFHSNGASFASKYTGQSVFALWLAAALLPWNFISAGVMGGMGALMGNASLLGKVYFPRWIPVVATILSLAVTFATEIAVLLVVMAIWGGPKVLLMIPFIILMMVITMAFVTGIALMLSIAVVYFRDVQHFMALFILVWLYLTPVIYSIDQVQIVQNEMKHPLPLVTLWTLNPAYRITDAFRTMLYNFQIPRWQDWAGAIVWAAVSLAIGAFVFRKFSSRVVEEL